MLVFFVKVRNALLECLRLSVFQIKETTYLLTTYLRIKNMLKSNVRLSLQSSAEPLQVIFSGLTLIDKKQSGAELSCA